MIGHLQRNKVKYIVDKVATDPFRGFSADLRRRSSRKLQNMMLIVPILIEVNVAQEESKFGLKTEEVLPLVEAISKVSAYKDTGTDDNCTICTKIRKKIGPIFRELKKLSVDIAAKNINNVNMSVLSMGMTGDYQVAVQEGATMVRVGTGIFGERDYSTRHRQIRLEIKMSVLDKLLDAVKLNDDYDDEDLFRR